MKSSSTLDFHLLSPGNFPDYELLDVGGFEKLERFGQYIAIRPEPQAVWSKRWTEDEWKKQAHVRFDQRSSNSGEWSKLKKMPDQWTMKYNLNEEHDIVFRLGLTAFKHVGIFPEQCVNWDFIYNSTKKLKEPQKRVLNLFAYTGGASLAARAAGAEVTHVDSIKQVVTWANENMQLSQLENIRWMVEDALKFVQREERRGNTYHGIIMDPPAFGHGPKGEKWKLEEHILPLVQSAVKLLDPSGHFLVLNAYSLGLSALIMDNLLLNHAGKNLQRGELFLEATSGAVLPLGVFGRFLLAK
ncbi:MAG: class I SAM-dependent methyltransferase [Flavobacteriales bacterium]|nr:class I SAM-dependent methyltransferase [Flavobacteriales bacterium]